jgi:hypothetical protein
MHGPARILVDDDDTTNRDILKTHTAPRLLASLNLGALPVRLR